ncbi:hypothetical protein L7F22_007915 [Adiantum nelumboides]|nr:hypothetical protein [Adiantum nelumboides]
MGARAAVCKRPCAAKPFSRPPGRAVISLTFPPSPLRSWKRDPRRKMKSFNGDETKSAYGKGSFAASDTAKTARDAEQSSFIGQGNLYAPPSSVPTSQQLNDSPISYYHEGVVADNDTPVESGSGRDSTVKLAVEKAMEKVKGIVPAESLDKALHVILSAFRDAESSTKDAVQRVKARLSDILPASNHSEVEKVVDDVQQEVLNKSEAAGKISSKL